jgi:hypothetical protein
MSWMDTKANAPRVDHAVRSDLETHDHAMSITIHEAVRELVDLLGATSVAVIGGAPQFQADLLNAARSFAARGDP